MRVVLRDEVERMSAAIVRADALRLPLRDESVDLVVTSPPYFALRSYTDGGEHYDGQIGSEPTPADFLRALWAVMDECWRVVKPTGVVFVNLGDKYAGSGGHNNSGLQGATSAMADRKHTQARNAVVKATRRNAPDRYNQSADVRPKSVMGLPWRFALGCSCPDPYRTIYEPGDHPQWLNRAPLIDDPAEDETVNGSLVWSKPNGLPESVKDRPRRSHEDWFMLTKEGAYYSDLDQLRVPHAAKTLTHRGGGQAHGNGDNPERRPDPRGVLPGSVWRITSEPLQIPKHLDVDHFAAFPQEWPRRLILGWSPPGGVVLDPFGGTGTTAMVARALGRFGISLDLSADYLRLARWRIFESGHASKSRERTNREAQGSLLGGAA